jgi:hypothetical protein
MNSLVRPVLLAAAVAIIATAAVWLSIMPDEPEDALEDGLIASLSASLITLVVSRRSTWLK